MDYWHECLSEAFDEASIVATDEQIKLVAKWVEGAHENYGMAHGYDCIPNPLVVENKRIAEELVREREKVVCEECKGLGRITFQGPYHSSDTECSMCHGEGKRAP